MKTLKRIVNAFFKVKAIRRKEEHDMPYRKSRKRNLKKKISAFFKVKVVSFIIYHSN
jgi:hypothetical protein